MIYALHGFLGHPSDWQAFTKIPSLVPCDLCQSGLALPHEGLWAWAQTFNRWVADHIHDALPTLLGYSLGGRLALHVLIDRPDLWQRAIIVSANTGLKTNDEKTKRLFHDEQWAKRFEVDPWELLMKDWNAQEIFGGHVMAPTREEKDYSRQTLAAMMRGWSLGYQEDLKEKLAELSIPILWITGELDRKFTALAQNVVLKHPSSRRIVVPGVAHRVPWESPFETLVNNAF
jgi:2-succinyl-6-hydroxy-2,4-cyclohexadiene-1-carboxylate synthase